MIGIFDSGLGGLCAVRELSRLLPNENIIYFGDTGRVPYGTKSRETIRKYTKEDARFLLSHGVKAILAACGTVSSNALECIRDITDVPVFGVVEDAAKAERMITTLMGDKVEGRKEFLAKYANFNKRDTFIDKIEKTSGKENGNGEN